MDDAVKKKSHDSETLERMRLARLHYETRANRRAKDMGRSDFTAYQANTGLRRSGKETLELRQVH